MLFSTVQSNSLNGVTGEGSRIRMDIVLIIVVFALLIGVSTIVNIFEHMSKSRKIIIVLTQHYLNDGMNGFELDQATTLYHEHELEDIIVIKIGDVPAKRVPVHIYTQMRKGTYLEWENNETAIQTFKEMLKDRLNGSGNV